MPNEVIVVDNGSTDSTREICLRFARRLRLRYFYERRSGIPYGRNYGIRRAGSDICAFLDDDCIAAPTWVEAILSHFATYRQSVGVIGRVHNASPRNLWASIEEAYYVRWMLRNVHDLENVQSIRYGTLMDFKNAAFRSSFIKQYPFSSQTPFGDVGDEDIEVGIRLRKANLPLYFDPKIQVKHRYSLNLRRLVVRNFWNGVSNKILEIRFGIAPSQGPYDVHVRQWLKRISFPNAHGYFFLFFYPLISRLGRLYASVCYRFTQRISIPTR